MKHILFCLYILLIFSAVATAQPQSIRIDVAGVPLNKVLLSLAGRYGFQLSYNEKLLSRYKVSVSKQFSSKEDALEYLLKGLPLSIEKAGEVFMLIPVEKKNIAEKNVPSARIEGQVLEAGTREPLPFSYIWVNRKQVQSDQYGNFSFTASADTSFSVHISHLGYYVYDTVLTRGLNTKFFLTPSISEIGEVVVKKSAIEKATQIGDKPGRMKINHNIAPYLPGYGDNSVFNVLRLMPGILASGELSSDLLIWGSYESHSKIVFDGFTLFGLKNYNDNISVVNPLVLKDIEIRKGGYEAKYGGRVGGIVNLTGKNGTLQKPTFTFNINTTTINSMLEVPLSKRSSLLAAFRNTYYELYDPTKFSLSGRKNNSKKNSASESSNGIDFSYTPDYRFRDGNLKYSFQAENGNAAVLSLYAGGDNYSYNLKTELVNSKLARTEEEKNRQEGGALTLLKNWGNGNSSNLVVSYSALTTTVAEQNRITNLKNGRERVQKEVTGDNQVRQFAASTENKVLFNNGHYLEWGTGFEANQVTLLRQSFSENLIDLDSKAPHIFFYAQDNLPVAGIFDIKGGIRASYAFNLQKCFAEPRFSVSAKITDAFKFNASWGLYNQFIAKTSVVDSSFNYYYFWANADSVTIPVLSAEHIVSGISFNKNDWNVSVEAYYKTTDGLTRFVNGTTQVAQGFYTGEGRTYGLDFFIKKEYKGHQAWISYTLSKAEEHFPYFRNYRLAPHDQRHELKCAAIINLKSFYFSANYVYGSGFERLYLDTSDGGTVVPDYSRMDAALIYRLKSQKIGGEIGISVLNVFDTENIKFSNLRRISTGNSVLLDYYAEAVPFTPTLFLKLKF